MYQIVDRLYVGTADEVPFAQQMGFSVLGVCKEPLHRQHAKLRGAETEGYLGRAMPKDEPEYLYAEREHALYCNLIDAADPKYISDEIINKALDFIDAELAQNRKVLIACNKGKNRSPSIAFMWLIRSGRLFTFDNMYEYFKENYYEWYQGSGGMYWYVKKFFENYMSGGKT